MTETLEQRYAKQPEMLAYLQRNLCRKGWAGKLDDCEREFLARVAPDWYVAARAAGARMAKEYPIHAKTPGGHLVNGERGKSARSGGR